MSVLQLNRQVLHKPYVAEHICEFIGLYAFDRRWVEPYFLIDVTDLAECSLIGGSWLSFSASEPASHVASKPISQPTSQPTGQPASQPTSQPAYLRLLFIEMVPLWSRSEHQFMGRPRRRIWIRSTSLFSNSFSASDTILVNRPRGSTQTFNSPWEYLGAPRSP